MRCRAWLRRFTDCDIFTELASEFLGLMSARKLYSIESGESHLSDGSSNLEIPMNSETWSVSQSFEDSVIESDVVLITVPTPVNSDRTPDLSIVECDEICIRIDGGWEKSNHSG